MIPLRRPFHAALVLLATGAAAFAQQDVTLENVTIGKQKGEGGLTAPRIEAKQSTLGREDLLRLFSVETAPADALALVRRFKAESLSAPLAEAKNDETTLTVRGLAMQGIDAGRIARLAIGSVDMKGEDEDGEPIEFRSGKLEAEGLDLSSLLDAAAGRPPAPHLRSLVWENLSAQFREKGGAKPSVVSMSLAAMTVATDFTSYDKPSRGEGQLRNLVIAPEAGSKFGRDLAAFGYDKLDMSLGMTASHDPAARRVEIENIALSGAGAGALSFKASLGNVDKGLWSQDSTIQAAALLLAEANRVEIAWRNDGLFEKTLAYVARLQKRNPDDVRREWAGLAGQLAPAMLGGDPASLKLAAELQKFIMEPKSLRIVVTAKSGALPLGELVSMDNPMALLQKVAIEATAN